MQDTTQDFLPASLWQGTVFDGAWSPARQSADVHEPASGALFGRIGMAGSEEIATAAATARRAQAGWAETSADQRAAILRKAASIAETHAGAIIDLIVRESGSIQAKAGFEHQVSVRSLWEASTLPTQPQGLVLPGRADRVSIAKRLPLGVVGVIAPFNFPLYLSIRAVAPALALGNAVVLKPDPRTAVCSGMVIARLFELAGLPAGVLQVLAGGSEAGARLCEDPSIAMIQFTGSTAAGRKVGELASRNLKKVSLELGGKNALIVLDDADLDQAVSAVAWGAYLHSGQICMSAGKILVQERLARDFTDRLAAKAKAMPVGDPMAGQVMMGPMINQAQRDRAHDIVNRAVAGGAVLEEGGTYEKLFYRPTVLSAVGPGNPAYREEVFGPVAAITSFTDEAQAIEMANDTEYGLSAGVLGSVARAMEVGRHLRTGLLHINDQTVDDDVFNPFGGVGASGNGSSIGGPANIEEFTRWQWMTIAGAPPAYPF